MNSTQAYDELIERIKQCHLLGSIGELLGWDERTHMPPKGGVHRAEQIALVEKLKHDWLAAPRIGELLAAVEGTPLVKEPNSDAAVNVREIRRAYDRAVKKPARLVEELARTTTLAQQYWQQARKENSFPIFQPWLEKIVTLKREEAQAVGYSSVAYDALLDEFEPGATTAEITGIFDALRKELVPLVAAVTSAPKKAPKAILDREYPVAQQEQFSRQAAAAVGFDMQAGRLDVTTHPFCCGIGPGDTRLTTRYNPRHFNEAFFGTLHEAGHGIYDQGLPIDRFGTPLGMAVSLGIHESQSRMWENQVGRSRAFWRHFYPQAQLLFAEALRDVPLDDFVFAINHVERSFIRVEADEVTYNMHIILRFELEQALISGDLRPADAPSAWNDKFTKMFDLTPANDAQGCLQDIHWSCGGIGYFPTYTLGNLYAAQFMEQARTDLPGLEEGFVRGEFGRLKQWLNDKIHRHGMRHRPRDLCKQVTGKPLTHAALMTYLKQKYGQLYGLNLS